MSNHQQDYEATMLELQLPDGQRTRSSDMQPFWLKNNYEDDIWVMEFKGQHNVVINFNVLLEDGSSLTSYSNAALLNYFKQWLCLQNIIRNQGVERGAASAYHRVAACLNLIDYFLLNADIFQLAGFGLSLCSSTDIDKLLYSLVQANRVSFSIYDWHNQLINFLEKSSQEIDVGVVLRNAPHLETITTVENCVFGLVERDRILRYRSYLWVNGYYKKSRPKVAPTTAIFSIDTKSIAEKLYANTLRGMSSKPIPEALLIGCRSLPYREYPAVPVKRNEFNNITRSKLRVYRAILNDLEELTPDSQAIHMDSLKQINNIFPAVLGLAERGQHFRSLPASVVFSSLRNSFEFFLMYGEGLLASYINIVSKCQKYNLKSPTALSSECFLSCIDESLADLQIDCWEVQWPVVEDIFSFTNNDLRQKKYFLELRKGKGLWNLLIVLFGSFQIGLGSLMARRQKEYSSFTVDQCLNEAKSHFRFFNRKSGSSDMRQVEERPIPRICVQMIESVLDFQSRLIGLGAQDDYLDFLARPEQNGLTLISQVKRQKCIALDTFCDYFEVTLDTHGHRYYIRTHQLRGFFATVFFWSGAPGGADTLRWFLAHVDVEHLHNYITETTPGQTFRAVQADLSASLIREGHECVEELSNLCERHFGTREFVLMEEQELEEYLENQLSEGNVIIKPDFGRPSDPESFKLIFRVALQSEEGGTDGY